MLSRSIVLFVTLVAVVTAAIVVSAAVAGARTLGPAALAASGGSGGDCGASGYVWGYDIACQSGTVSPGAQARPASSTADATTQDAAPPASACGLYPIAGNPGHMLQVCPTGLKIGGGMYGVRIPNTVNTVVPVGGGAAVPQVTPQQLLAWAQAQLKLPLPGIKTAPPHGSDGLVGLPEWFWVDPAQWHPVTAQVAVGAVWAQVTARPVQITIRPGTGTAVTCDGPGTAYDPKLPAQSQHSDCTWTYGQSSDGLPGNAYQASVTVTWDATWSGAGGAGGALAPDEETAAFTVPVAEAQSLTPAGS
jgi:hypothetical protein